jgi:uncharacterized membrane protein YcfT
MMRVDSGRVGWVDTAKGAAILLVVLWHAYLAVGTVGDLPSWLDALNRTLANVRMPLFFLASGLLMERLVERPWGELARKRVVPMAWILVVWTLIGSGINLVVPLHPWNDSPLEGIGQLLWLPQGNLWFVYALLVFAVMARVAALASGWQRVAIALALWLTLVAYDVWRDEFHTRNMGLHFPFYIAGVLGAGRIKLATASWQGLATIAVVSLAGLVAIALMEVDGLAGVIGDNVFGTGLFVLAAVAIQPWSGLTRWLDAAGRNSLTIFLGHTPVIAAAFAVLPLRAADPVLIWLLLFALAVAGTLLLRLGAQRLGLGWLYRVPEAVTDWRGLRPSKVSLANHG